MIKPNQIPNEVVEAALEAYAHASGLGIIPYDDEDWHEDLVNGMRAAIAAALNAWPGVKPHEVQVPDDTSDDIRYVLKTVGIILPLPQKEGDA